MTDFWFSVLWTVLIASLTVMIDWVTHRLVLLQDCFTTIRSIMDDNALTDANKRAQCKVELDKLKSRFAETSVWGSDLVTVAIALDVACLGLSVTNKLTLGFFDKWDSADTDRTLQLWLLVMLAYAVCLLLSIIFRHKHSTKISAIAPGQIVSVLQPGWIRQDFWALASKTVGLVSLMSAFSIIYDALG